MRTRVKVCCIASVDEAQLAVGCGADALGLVGPMPSGPGVIDEATAAEIARTTPPPVATFLLTSRTDADAIAEHAQRVRPTVVQVVQHIDPSESRRLRSLLGGPRYVQVIHVEGGEALELLDTYAPHVDAFLLDSGRPSAEVPELGGTGRVHDWQISARFVERSPRPVFLAGGLTPDNVADAIRTVRPFGLDLCSGVRTEGRLDPAKLGRFIAEVERTDAALSAAKATASTGMSQVSSAPRSE